MTRSYGKLPRRYGKVPRAGATPAAKNLRIKIKGRYDLEQLSQLLQQIIARLEDKGVGSVEDCALYLAPLTQGGDRMAIKDAAGKPLETIEISLPVSARFKATAAW